MILLHQLIAFRDINPDVKWIKAIDTTATEANGQPKIVGVAQYTIFQPDKEYPEVPYFLRSHVWPDAFEKEYAMHLWEGYVRPRREVLKTSNHPVISKVFTLSVPHVVLIR